MLVERDWYRLGRWNLVPSPAADGTGCCRFCGTAIPGRFEAEPGAWGAKRLPVRLQNAF